MTATELTNQLMLAIIAYGEYRHDTGRAAGEDAPAQQHLNAEFAEEEYENIQRLVRELSALAPKVAIATTEQIRERQAGPTCPICGHGTWLHIGDPSRCCTQIDVGSCGCETTFDEERAAITVTMCDLRGRFERLDQVSFDRGRLSVLREIDPAVAGEIALAQGYTPDPDCECDGKCRWCAYMGCEACCNSYANGDHGVKEEA